MDWRRLPAVFWAALAVFTFLAGLVGLVLGGLLFPRAVKVEVPVEVVRTVEKPVTVPERLTADQESWMKEMKPALAAVNSPSVGYLETAVMPLRNKVKVGVLMSDDLNVRVPRSSVQAKVEQRLREAGIEVLPDEAPAADYNTTIFVIFDVMVQDKTGMLIGEVRVNINQTMLCYSGDAWRKSNLMTAGFATTISYGTEKYPAIVDVAGDLCPEVAKVLIKADEIGRAQAGR
jgi:hypothetical protein